MMMLFCLRTQKLKIVALKKLISHILTLFHFHTHKHIKITNLEEESNINSIQKEKKRVKN